MTSQGTEETNGQYFRERAGFQSKNGKGGRWQLRPTRSNRGPAHHWKKSDSSPEEQAKKLEREVHKLVEAGAMPI